MIAATPGDAIWLREGVFLIKDLYSEKGHGIPAGTFLNKPCRGIFLERKTIKSKSYIKALESRCHYLDLTIDTDREKLLRIRQVTQDHNLFETNGFEFADYEKDEVIDFIDENKHKMRELSLRMVIKVASLKASMPNWKRVAALTCMKRV